VLVLTINALAVLVHLIKVTLGVVLLNDLLLDLQTALVDIIAFVLLLDVGVQVHAMGFLHDAVSLVVLDQLSSLVLIVAVGRHAQAIEVAEISLLLVRNDGVHRGVVFKQVGRRQSGSLACLLLLWPLLLNAGGLPELALDLEALLTRGTHVGVLGYVRNHPDCLVAEQQALVFGVLAA
jgi:hypothetical protein